MEVVNIVVHPDSETSEKVGSGREVDDYEAALRGIITDSPDTIVLFDYTSDPALGNFNSNYWDLVDKDRRVLTVPGGGVIENPTEARRLWGLLEPCLEGLGKVVIHGTYLEACVNMFAWALHDAITDQDISWLTYHYLDRMHLKLTSETSSGVVLEFGNVLSGALQPRSKILWLRDADELVTDQTEIYYSFKPRRGEA